MFTIYQNMLPIFHQLLCSNVRVKPGVEIPTFLMCQKKNAAAKNTKKKKNQLLERTDPLYIFGLCLVLLYAALLLGRNWLCLTLYT